MSSFSQRIVTLLTVLLLIGLSGVALTAPAAGEQVLPNSDVLVNWQSSRLLTQLYQMSPSSFGADGYLSALIDAYNALNADVSVDSVQLVEWCPWPNATLQVNEVSWGYCSLGTATASFTQSTHVLVSYQVLTANQTALQQKLDLAAPYNSPVSNVALEMDPALYNPDTRNTLDQDTGLVHTVTHDPVAFWAIFGCLLALVVGAAILLAVLRCHRDRKQRERNKDTVRGAMHQYTRHRTSFFPPLPVIDRGSKSTRGEQGAAAKGGARYGAGAHGDVRSKYEVSGAGHSDPDEPNYAANGGGYSSSARPTSRASAYWPGGAKDAGREAADGDREMEEKVDGKNLS